MALPGEGEAIPLTTDTPYAIVMSTYLNVRSGPGINFTSLGQVIAGDTLPIVGRTADGQWFQVETPFGTGWVAAGFVVTRNEFGASPVTTASAAEADVAGPVGIVNTGALNVRTGPGPQYTSLGTLAGGTEVLIIGRNANWSWYLIETPVGTGWGSALYIVARGDTAGIPFVPAGATVDQGGGFAGGTAPEPVVAGPVAIVRTGALNVRTGPNSAFPSLGAVLAGTRLPIIGQSPDHGWWLVESPYGEGYVTKALVTTEGNTSDQSRNRSTCRSPDLSRERLNFFAYRRVTDSHCRMTPNSAVAPRPTAACSFCGSGYNAC
jgi:N-acetylmuramoyl-L-alanine amidase